MQVRNVVQEKEDRIKEGMQIMGLSNAAFWLSWIVTYLAMMIVTSGLMTLACRPVFRLAKHHIAPH